MKKSNRLTFSLSKKMLGGLMLYFVILIIIGSILVIKYVSNSELQKSTEDIVRGTFIASISVSAMLSSIQYIKRLYKACIEGRIDENDNHIKMLGNLTYFLTRPIFAIVFAIILVIAALSGMLLVTGSLDYVLNMRFLYMCAFMSSFVGFSVGSILDQFEHISEKKIDQYMKGQEE